MSFTSILQIFAGVGLLVYGIIIMGETLQIIAGDRLRTLLAKLTGTPLKGLVVGTTVTGILQSSSATTVMVVSFVDSGLMTLTQAIGVILGADIGTTVTAQLMAFKILNLAYICALFGAAMCMLSHKKRNKQIGVGILGFGLLFIGMEMMSEPMSYLKENPQIMTIFGDHIFLAFLSGLAVTLVIQSSSATVGLTMAIAAQGIIPLETAIAIIFGDNIGTTITAVLASLGGNRAAKQAACAHVMIKVISAGIMFPLIPLYSSFIAMTTSDISRQVANSHTIFSIIMASMFIGIVPQYARFIKKVIPDDKNAEVLGPMFLNPKLIDASRAASVDAVRKEMIRLGTYSLKMIENCRMMFIGDDEKHKEKLSEEVLREETNVNDLTHEIVRYTTEVGQTGLSHDLSLLLNSFTGGVGDIERIGDHATNLVEMYQFLQNHKLKLSPKAIEECREMFDLVISAVAKSVQALEDENPKIAQEVLDLEDRIDYMEKTLRARHIARLNAGGCSPDAGVIFIDILSNLERVGDHAHNIAMVVFDIESMHSRGA